MIKQKETKKKTLLNPNDLIVTHKSTFIAPQMASVRPTSNILPQVHCYFNYNSKWVEGIINHFTSIDLLLDNRIKHIILYAQ